jgi:hypothetical protein
LRQLSFWVSIKFVAIEDISVEASQNLKKKFLRKSDFIYLGVGESLTFVNFEEDKEERKPEDDIFEENLERKSWENLNRRF